MIMNRTQMNIPCFSSPIGNGKKDIVCKHISPSCTTAEANRMWTNENTLKLTEDLRLLPCLLDVHPMDYKNHNKKVDACDTLATKYGVSAVEVGKKIQALKMQFHWEEKKLVHSERSRSSRKKVLGFDYEPLWQNIFSIPCSFIKKVSSPPTSPISSSAPVI
jgi:hypothetical protein